MQLLNIVGYFDRCLSGTASERLPILYVGLGFARLALNQYSFESIRHESLPLSDKL
jgi:hypothetical protein